MPLAGGHENVADVVEAHPSDSHDWVGKRVCVEPTLGCEARGIDPPCGRCAVGEFGACEHFGSAGEGRYALPAGTSLGYNSRTGGRFRVAGVKGTEVVPVRLSLGRRRRDLDEIRVASRGGPVAAGAIRRACHGRRIGAHRRARRQW